MEVLHVFLKFSEPGVVPMDGNDVGLDLDFREELLDPIQAVGSRGGRGRGQNIVALLLKGGNILVPQSDAFVNAHLGLAILVDPAKRRGTASEKMFGYF